jgi:predicted lactoylglutathione lyase
MTSGRPVRPVLCHLTRREAAAVPHAPIILSLPIADRPTSFAFYRDGLGLEPFGKLADDGVPEPLQFDLHEGVRLMLIPRGGFGWVVGSHEVAASGTSECLVNLTADSPAEVDELIKRAADAGATTITEPGPQPWGYAGSFADPDGHLWMINAAAPAPA